MTTGYHAAFEPAMREALAEAAAALRQVLAGPATGRQQDGPAEPTTGMPDVPVGAVMLGPSGTVLARAHNEREAGTDPTAHAEIVAIRAAARTVRSWRLDGCTLVVTLEPCTMCAGAVTAARLERLVYGAPDPKAGAVGSLWDVVRDTRLSHHTEVVAGILAPECGALLREFFATRRNRAELRGTPIPKPEVR